MIKLGLAARVFCAAPMSQINPFTPVQPFSQKLQADRVKRAQARERGGDDEVDHQVETADAVVQIHDQNHEQQQNKKREQHSPPTDDSDSPPSHLDITA